MAEHTHTTYSCDRCGADLGAERPKRPLGNSIRASFNYREGPGPSYDWVDLCDRCDAAVKAFFIGTTTPGTQPTKEEKRTALEYFETQLEAGIANTEPRDHRLVRAYRMLQGTKP